MELPLHLNRWERRRTDWPAAAAAGLAGGAVLMVLELLWSAMVGDAGPWRTSRWIAALALGPGVMQTPAFSFDIGVVAVALATHYLLGVAFGLVLGFIATGFRYEADPRAMLVLGAVFGALLYLFNFHAIVRFFPWFVEMQGWTTLFAHLVFGVTAALLYWKLAGVRAIPQGSL